MERFTSETETQLNMLNVNITVERQIARVNNALDTIQRNVYLMIESALNAQKIILQPQIFSPDLFIGTLRKSISVFPFTFSKDSYYFDMKHM
jgi:hypothetical protein